MNILNVPVEPPLRDDVVVGIELLDYQFQPEKEIRIENVNPMEDHLDVVHSSGE